MKYLLDTMALLAFFNDEEGADLVEEIIDKDEEIYISSITLTEIYYIYSRRVDKETAKERVNQLRYNLEIVPLGEEESIKAGRYKIKSIPVADALIAACAESIDAGVVTADEHFEDTDVDVIHFR